MAYFLERYAPIEYANIEITNPKIATLLNGTPLVLAAVRHFFFDHHSQASDDNNHPYRGQHLHSTYCRFFDRLEFFLRTLHSLTYWFILKVVLFVLPQE